MNKDRFVYDRYAAFRLTARDKLEESNMRIAYLQGRADSNIDVVKAIDSFRKKGDLLGVLDKYLKVEKK